MHSRYQDQILEFINEHQPVSSAAILREFRPIISEKTIYGHMKELRITGKAYQEKETKTWTTNGVPIVWPIHRLLQTCEIYSQISYMYAHKDMRLKKLVTDIAQAQTQQLVVLLCDLTILLEVAINGITMDGAYIKDPNYVVMDEKVNELFSNMEKILSLVSIKVPEVEHKTQNQNGNSDSGK